MEVLLSGSSDEAILAELQGFALRSSMQLSLHLHTMSAYLRSSNLFLFGCRMSELDSCHKMMLLQVRNSIK